MLCLLGEPRFSGEPVSLERVTYMLAILACRDEWVSRDELILLLWGDTDEAAGRQRLRQLLYRARSFAHAEGLEADASRVRFTAPCDLREFRAAIRDARWRDAIRVYTGEFLQNVPLPDNPELEEFVAFSREEFALSHRRATLHVATTLEGTAALEVLETALERDPLAEDLLRECLRLAARSDVETGKRVFERHTRAVRALGLEVDAELLTLRVGLDEATPAQWFAAPRASSRLPVPTTAFIGRQTELSAVAERLRHPSCQLVTILGPGGAGKTRLSLEVATVHGSAFRDGAVFVSLAPLASPDLVPGATLEALGMQGGDDPRERLLTHLENRELLLVLDNLEHLPGVGVLVAEILERAPGVRIVTTSREALGLRAEHVFELSGLPAPDTLFPLETQDAALLFLRAAQRVQQDFRFSNDLEAFTRIYHAVSGMPLGLELASSWVRAMSLSEIASELQRSLDFLEVDSPDVPVRHRSFAAAFRSSWTLLNDAERSALARMSVFRGGFTRDMAQSVAQCGVAVLLRLVNKSLVSRSETRFYLHEMIRQYAAQELPGAQREVALEALARACLELAEDWYKGSKGERQVELSRRLEQDNDNLRTALEWSLTHDIRLGAGIAGNLEHFWYTRGYHREGVGWATRFLAAPELEPRDGLRLQLLWVIVSLCKELSEYDRSREALREYEAIALEIGDQAALALSEKFMGLLTREQGDLIGARERLERAKTMFEALGERNQVGICWNDLGVTYAYTRELEAAKHCFEQSLEIKREIGDKQGIAYALGNLGNLASMMGDDDLDRVYQEESLRMKRELGDAQGIANSLHSIGDSAMNQGNLSLARTYFQESLEIFLRLGRQWAMTQVLMDFAKLEAKLNRFDAALRLVTAALASLRRLKVQPRPSNLGTLEDLRSKQPFSEAERVRYELEGERLSLEEAVSLALGQQWLETKAAAPSMVEAKS
jgi:predicted ATPase/DNA-binding SARP family transcriptional activator